MPWCRIQAHGRVKYASVSININRRYRFAVIGRRNRPVATLTCCMFRARPVTYLAAAANRFSGTRIAAQCCCSVIYIYSGLNFALRGIVAHSLSFEGIRG